MFNSSIKSTENQTKKPPPPAGGLDSFQKIFVIGNLSFVIQRLAPSGQIGFRLFNWNFHDKT